jgi:hypothetical protein
VTDPLRHWLVRRLGDFFVQTPVVVWHDESGTLGPVLRAVLPPDVEMPSFEGNPLSLRQRIDRDDPWLERKWLLYVPRLPDGVICEWLVDLQEGFRVVTQGTLAWALREALGLRETPELRRLLRGPAAAALAARFGQYLPHVRERLDDTEAVAGLLRAGIEAPAASDTDLVLRYLTVDADVERWSEQGLLPAMTTLVRSRLGLRRHLVDGQPPDRSVLARCLVASALVESGAADARPLANHLPREEDRPRWAAALVQGLAETHRRGALLPAIDRALAGSELVNEPADPERLARAPALPAVESRLLDLLASTLPPESDQLPSWWARVIAVADDRCRAAGGEGGRPRPWATLRDAAELLARARDRLQRLATYSEGALDRLAAEYVDRERGDWQLDALYRSVAHGESGLRVFWEQHLLAPARDAYHRVTRELVARFVQAVAARGEYRAAGFMRQRAFWDEMVDGRPDLALLLVDALRTDLAYALVERLEGRGFQVEVRRALAELPTRTEIGMVALLPRAHEGFAVRVEQGRLVPAIGAARIPGTAERWRYLEAHGTRERRGVCRDEVGAYLRPDSRLLVDCRERGALPVAHTTDLDEGGDIAATVSFEVFNQVLDRCARFVEQALEAGFAEVVVAGDHGFLVRDPEAAPGGVPGTVAGPATLARGLRYAAGVGEIGRDLVQVTAKMLGRDGDDVYVPRGTGCLALPGGPGLFVHGGLSPHECALVFLRIVRSPGQLAPARVRLRVPDRVTTLAFPVSVVGDAAMAPLLVAPRDVALLVQDGRGSVVWRSPEVLRMVGSTTETVETRVVTVPTGGEYVVLLRDSGSQSIIEARQIRVDVLGADFTF